MLTTYERGRIEGQRHLAMRLLDAKFGPLSAEVERRVEALPPEQLEKLVLDLLKAQSLKDLELED